MAKKNKKKGPLLTDKMKLWMIILLTPASIVLYILAYLLWVNISDLPFLKSDDELVLQEYNEIQKNFDMPIPRDYVPLYMEAAAHYQIPWTLIAAHHRIETRFSTMKTLISPVGAEGHLQFMPCTFVGWAHPTCGDLGQGEIPEEEKVNPSVISKYGGYGVDANGDGKADPFDIEDAVFSAANYLASSGAQSGNLEKAIFAYNHSEQYVKDVLHFYHLYNEQKRAIEINLME